MVNIALRELVTSLRIATPGIGMKVVTGQVKQRMHANFNISKKDMRDIYQLLDRVASAMSNQPAAPEPINDNTIKEAFEDFRGRERRFLLSLSQKDRDHLAPEGNAPPSWYAAAHLRHHIEILFTLKGIKPCTLLMFDWGLDRSMILNRLVVECLAPVMERFDLEKAGFKLIYLAGDVLTSDLTNPGYKDCWVFADTKSQHWGRVKDIFTPHPTRRTEELEIGQALGYPVKEAYGGNPVFYKDQTEQSLLADEVSNGDATQVCCVDGMQFFTVDGTTADWKLILSSFKQCRDAAESVGIILRLDLARHPNMERYVQTPVPNARKALLAS